MPLKKILLKYKLKPCIVLSRDDFAESKKHSPTTINALRVIPIIKECEREWIHNIPPTSLMIFQPPSFLVPQWLLQILTLLNPQFLSASPQLQSPRIWVIFSLVPLASELVSGAEPPSPRGKQREEVNKKRFSSVQLLSHVWLFATPWTIAHQAFLSISNFWSLLKLMFIKSVMPSNHLILCHSFLLLTSIFPASQFFSSGSQRIGALASGSVLPMNIEDWFPLGLTGLISLQSKDLSRVFSNTTVQKHQFFGAQLSFFFFKLVFYFLNFKILNSYMRSQTWTPLPPPSP